MEEIVKRIKKLAKEGKLVYSSHFEDRALERDISPEESQKAVVSGLITQFELGYDRFSAISRLHGRYLRVGIELKRDWLIVSTAIELNSNSWEVKQYKEWLRSKRE